MGFRHRLPFIDQAARDAAAAAGTTADEALWLAANGIVPGSRLAADAIDGMTVTGATLRTAATGQRVQIDSTAGLVGYDAAGDAVTTVGTNGQLTAKGATVAGVIRTADAGARVELGQVGAFGRLRAYTDKTGPTPTNLAAGTTVTERPADVYSSPTGDTGRRLILATGGRAYQTTAGTIILDEGPEIFLDWQADNAPNPGATVIVVADRIDLGYAGGGEVDATLYGTLRLPGTAELRGQALRAPALVTTRGAVNNAWSSTTYLWVAGLGDKYVVPADGLARDWQTSTTWNQTGDGWVRLVCDLAASATKAATRLFFPNSTGFRNVVPSGAELGLSFQDGGTLLGDQQATFYLEARATVSGGASFILPRTTYRFLS